MRLWTIAAGILGSIMVAVFFTDFPLYGFEAHFLPPPILFFSVFGLAVALLASFRPAPALAQAKSWFAIWLLGFLFVTLAWYFMTIQNEDYATFLRQRLYSLGFLVTCLVLMAYPEARRAARIALVFAVLLGVGLNFVDLVQPLTFSPFLARSTGLYLNPNVAGIALVLGALAAWEIVPTRLRPWFYGLVILGVVPTFSRSAIIMALLLGPVLCLAGHMTWRAWGTMILAVGGLTVLIASILMATGWIPVDSSQMQDLLLRVTLSSEDYSTEDRLQVMREVLAMIVRSPWIGHGTGASYLWALDRSSHNVYLNLMADHGVWAVIIVPAFFASLARKTFLCGLFILCWLAMGFVSHNLFDETAWLALLAFTPYLGESLEPASSV